MKNQIKLLSVFLILVSIVACSSIKHPQKPKVKPVVVKTDLVNITLNRVNIYKVYAATKETTNIEYRTFLNDLKAKGELDLYNKCMYDSTLWQTAFKNRTKDTLNGIIGNFSYNEPMVNNYHHHPAYDHYPIVNISFEAANEYCKWLTEQYMANDKREFKKVEFMLPTEQQWKYACAPYVDNTLPWYGKEAYNQDYEFYANIKFRNTMGSRGFNYIQDGGFHTLIVGHYKPNSRDLYDIIGNIAEMTNLDGVQKGGSWDNFIEECTTDRTQTFNNADPRVGIRVFMKVIEE